MRLKWFLRSLLSGYAVLLANVAYTVISVPLALHYLERREFGLWLLAAQLAGYLGLIDLGMSGVSRILIDYKDTKEDKRYGSSFQTTIVVSAAQALIIVVVGFVASRIVGPLLDVPAEFEASFATLAFAHALLLAAGFLTRIFSYVLMAHQRYDVTNYTQVFSFIVNLAVLYFAFRRGAGLFSIIWSQTAAWLFPSFISFLACWKMGLLPRRGARGRANWASFKEIFKFGQDIFLLMVGFQLVNASQTVIVTRMLGLEALALWSICTRVVGFINQFVYRIFDYSSAALAEMFVRNERTRLYTRFCEIIVTSCSLAVFLGSGLIVCNQPFVALWTGGRFGWHWVNDCLVAVWLLLSVWSRGHIGLLGQTKLIHGARYIYVVEGLLFIAASWLVIPFAGLTGMLGASIVSNLLCSASYGAWRTSRQFEISWRDVVVGWMRRPARLAVRMMALAAFLLLITQRWTPAAQFLIGATAICLAGGFWTLRVGMPEAVKREIGARLPHRLAWITGERLP